MQEKLSKLTILIGSAIIIFDIVFFFIYKGQTLLAFFTSLFFLLIASLVNIAKYKKLFCKSDLSLIIFIVMFILALILDPSESNIFSIHRHSLFLPIDLAIHFSFLTITLWWLRSIYFPTSKRVALFQSILFICIMGLFLISDHLLFTNLINVLMLIVIILVKINATIQAYLEISKVNK